MLPRTFKEVFASVKPDRPASRALSPAERLAKVVPPIVPEVLECRRLYTVLTVTGDNSANYIELYYDIGHDSLAVFVDSDPADLYNPSGYTSASVTGLGGNDTIVIRGGNGDGGDFTLPAWIDGGNGDDDISGGDFADTIYGGVGYDVIDAGNGADVVYGGTGSGDDSDSVTGYDLIHGGDGNDSLFGEGGGDSIYGGDGADSIRGGDFDDYIKGDDGADTMYGGNGDDSLDARELTSATDVLFGGNGNDSGWWTTGVDSATDMEGNFTP